MSFLPSYAYPESPPSSGSYADHAPTPSVVARSYADHAPTPSVVARQMSLNAYDVLRELGLDPDAAANLSAYKITRGRDGEFSIAMLKNERGEAALFTQTAVLHMAQHAGGTKAPRRGDGGGAPPRVPSADSLAVPTLRDVAVLDHNKEASKKPAILCRRGCIFLCAPPMRALVTHNEAWLFPEQGMDEELGNFQSILLKKQEASFEVCVLSACLSACLAKLWGRLNSSIDKRRRINEGFLEGFFKQLQELELEILELISDAVAHLGAVQKVIDSEENVLWMVLEARFSDGRVQGSGGGDGGGGDGNDKLEKARQQAAKVMEVLLEWFEASVENAKEQAEGELTRIRSSKAGVEMSIATEQKRLIQLQLIVTIVTMGLACMSVVSGFFGCVRAPQQPKAAPAPFARPPTNRLPPTTNPAVVQHEPKQRHLWPRRVRPDGHHRRGVRPLRGSGDLLRGGFFSVVYCIPVLAPQGAKVAEHEHVAPRAGCGRPVIVLFPFFGWRKLVFVLT
jgi:hypothetical protein